MLVLTPLYTPYARLALPWLIAAWIGAGAGLDFLWRDVARVGRRDGVPTSTPSPLVVGIMAVGMVCILQLGLAVGIRQTLLRSTPNLTGGSATATYEVLLQRIESVLKARQGKDSQVLVYGDPAIHFQLRLRGYRNTAVVGDLGFLSSTVVGQGPLFLFIGGDLSTRTRAEQEIGSAKARLTRIELPAYRPRVWSLLDASSPAQLRKDPQRLQWEPQLIEIAP